MRKHFFRNLFLCMIAAVILLVSTITSLAAESPYLEALDGVTIMGTTTILYKDSSTGLPAYSLDYDRGIPDSSTFSGEFDPETVFDSKVYYGLENLLLTGYPYDTGGLSKEEAQSCTQLAIWCWAYEAFGTGPDANSFAETPEREDIRAYFTRLLEASRNQTPIDDAGIDVTDFEMRLDGDTLKGETTIMLRNLSGGYTLDESVLPDDMTVSGYTGADGDVLLFTAPVSYAGESIATQNLFTSTIIRPTIKLFGYNDGHPDQQRIITSHLEDTKTTITAGISFYFESEIEFEYGTIQINKIAAENKMPLPGAVFGVYRVTDDSIVCELETGADGFAMSIELPSGDYYLRELKAPENYILSEDTIFVAVTANRTAEVTVVNFPVPVEPNLIEGDIRLLKKDADSDEPLGGAVFGVYRVSGDIQVCELETADDGTITSPKLPAGDYYIKELIAPDSYELSEEKVGVTVKPDETTEITVTNKRTPEPQPDPETPEGDIRLLKKDADSDEPLGGAVFGVYRVFGDVQVCELITTDDGTITSPKLPAGDYYIKEMKAPDSYELSEEKYGVTVKPDETTEITIVNKRIPEPIPDPEPLEGDIKLVKKDEDDGHVLGSAVFGVYRVSDDVQVCELKTADDGTATSLKLPAGEYYLKERKAPDSYELSPDKYGVMVMADETTEITITNKKIKVVEPTTTSAPASTTPTNPTTLTNTPNPTSPSAAIIPTSPTSVPIVTSSTSTASASTQTDPTPSDPQGKILLIKRAEQTSSPLTGAIFGIHLASDDKKVSELTTGADGRAEKTLPVGDYYLHEINAPYGYHPENAKIHFTILKDATVTVEVTDERDASITDLDTKITIPKTGQIPPYGNYILSILMFGIAGYFVILYFRKKDQITFTFI